METLTPKSIQIQNGENVFAGTTVSVSLLFNYLKSNKTTEDFLDDFPVVSLAQVLGVLEQAEDGLKNRF